LLLVANRLPEAEFDAALADIVPVSGSISDDDLVPVSGSISDDDDWTIPDYVYDVHTRLGRRRGKTRAGFIRQEHDALSDGSSIFKNADAMIDSAAWVQPEFDWPS
jgi:hypothetical protein